MDKRDVVDESEFVQDLEKIIERDFYPDLESLKNQKEYFEALESNDVSKLRLIQMKMQNPGCRKETVTPSTSFETPKPPSSKRLVESFDGTFSNPEPPKKKSSADLHLDQYLSNYTSEDDIALVQLMSESEQRKRSLKPWLYESSDVERKKSEALLALPSPESQAAALDHIQVNRDLVTWDHKAQNSVMFIPDGAPLSEKEKLEIAGRKPRAIVYENTRFKVSTTIGVRPSTSNSLSIKKLEGRIGIDGKEVSNNTPGVGGYKYMATPSPAPGAMGESPFMTWGHLESTPVLVDPSASPLSAPSFKIPEMPEREQLAIDLAERVSSRNRDKKQTALKTAAESVRRYASPSQRITSMSPAAQKLIAGRLGSGISSQSSYTPSPLVRTPKTPSAITPSLVRRAKDTPNRSTPGPSSSSSGNLKRAEDFF